MFPPKKKTMMGGDGPGMPPPVEKMPKPTADQEAGETPDYEATEEAGADFVKSICQAGAQFGLSDPDAKEFASQIFSKAMDMLGASPLGSEEESEPVDNATEEAQE